MNILVTGGAGYIGSHTTYSLLDGGHNVTVIDNLSTGFKEIIPENVTFYEGCVSDEALVTRIIHTHNVEAIIHFAGSISVEESINKPHLYYKNNTENSRHLIETSVKNNVNNFVFSSTAATYGPTYSKQPVSETMPQQPSSPYGWSKLFIEQILKDTSAATSTFNYGILRYFNVAGSDKKGRTGQISKNSTHLIKIASEVASGKRREMTIFGDDYDTPDGTCLRDFIHVSDVATVHRLLVEHISSKNKSVIFNCGYGIGHSVKQVIDTYAKVTGKQIPHTISPRRQGDIPYIVADSSSLRKELNWTPQHDSLEEIIQSSYDWEQRLSNMDLHFDMETVQKKLDIRVVS